MTPTRKYLIIAATIGLAPFALAALIWYPLIRVVLKSYRLI